MSDNLSDQQFFSMGFNSGIAAICQVMQKYKGSDLEAIVIAGHKVSTQELAKIMDQPEEDIALFLKAYVDPVQAAIDKGRS